MTDKFIDAYAHYMEWPERGRDAVARRICEDGFYSPENGRDLLILAQGWFWGSSGDYVAASCEVAVIKLALDTMYAVVAKENNWEQEP